MITSREYKSKIRSKKSIITVTDVIEVDNRNFLQRIETIVYLKQLDIREVGRKFGIDQKHYFLQRLENGRLDFDDQRKLADILDVELNFNILLNDGTVCTGNNTHEMIMAACEATGITISEMAIHFGTTRQAFQQRISNDRLPYEDIEKIAEYLGGTYNHYFEFDGIKL